MPGLLPPPYLGDLSPCVSLLDSSLSRISLNLFFSFVTLSSSVLFFFDVFFKPSFSERDAQIYLVQA